MSIGKDIENFGLNELSDFMDRCLAEDALKMVRGSKLLQIGATLTEKSSAELVQAYTISAIMKQNWIMIRQLDRIEKALTKEKEKPVTQSSLQKPQKEEKPLPPGVPIDFGYGSVKCPNCGTVQRAGRIKCFSCGMEFIK